MFGLGLAVERRVRVTCVQIGSPAAQAGLRYGDVLQALDGAALPEAEELRAKLRTARQVTLQFQHAGEALQEVTLNKP
jgi:S1-C subfamily serine protease